VSALAGGVAVTGPPGGLAGRVRDEFARRGVPLESREGAPVAEVVVHCAGPEALADTLRRSAFVVLPSLVGCDVIPSPAHTAARVMEEMLAAAARPGVVVRATETHDRIWEMFERRSRSPLVVVPHGVRYQPVDPAAVAALIADAAEGLTGQRCEVGGRYAYEAAGIARSVMAAIGRVRPLVRLNAPGIRGAAYRAGANLTPHRDETGATWNEFVSGREAPT
jgi:hypothetical protein